MSTVPTADRIDRFEERIESLRQAEVLTPRPAVVPNREVEVSWEAIDIPGECPLLCCSGRADAQPR